MTSISIRSAPGTIRPRRIARVVFCLCVCAGLLAVLSPVSAQLQQTGTQAQDQLSNPLPHLTSVLAAGVIPTPDANQPMEMQQQKLKRASYEAANAERKRQLDTESAQILKLASELKGEIDGTSQDTLSLSVVRKADEIERLAHNVQVKMKFTVGAD
ncbi:MAG: hypothetical protein WCF17_17305 [Terracidiphilus sp.]